MEHFNDELYTTIVPLISVVQLQEEGQFMWFSYEHLKHFIDYTRPASEKRNGINRKAYHHQTGMPLDRSTEGIYTGLSHLRINEDRDLNSPQSSYFLSKQSNPAFITTRCVSFWCKNCSLPCEQPQNISPGRAPYVLSGPKLSV